MLFSYEDEDTGKFSNLYLCTFKEPNVSNANLVVLKWQKTCHLISKQNMSFQAYSILQVAYLKTNKPCKAKINHSKNLKQGTYMYLNSGPLKQS